jgi:hypothetical protein
MVSGTKKLIPEESQIPLEELSGMITVIVHFAVFINSSYLLWLAPSLVLGKS